MINAHHMLTRSNNQFRNYESLKLADNIGSDKRTIKKPELVKLAMIGQKLHENSAVISFEIGCWIQ